MKTGYWIGFPKDRQEALSGLKYLTSELEANVREHAEVEDYWIFAQYLLLHSKQIQSFSEI
jgi:hypothetical protein